MKKESMELLVKLAKSMGIDLPSSVEEGVDVEKELKELSDLSGVDLEEVPEISKERKRDIYEEARKYFREGYFGSCRQMKFLRGLLARGGYSDLGIVPDDISLREYLGVSGYSEEEMIGADLLFGGDMFGVWRERFRPGELVLAVRDADGFIVGFVGCRLGSDGNVENFSCMNGIPSKLRLENPLSFIYANRGSDSGESS